MEGRHQNIEERYGFVAPLDANDSSGIRPNVEMNNTLLKNHVILGLRTRGGHGRAIFMVPRIYIGGEKRLINVEYIQDNAMQQRTRTCVAKKHTTPKF
ncbi:predicted protein [Sclerotinia sclerotiorum 1980 UF-70]|uniref:Uncharacterized protein n=1 Tax=Sclerotinia sclerotiorum (strain ATCC 18683 / 1980 / Ss-1) TaxID=665079 RepID=A7EV60_SCLS1|nr:predicted protein [Sclerotinia sclerotiorum 1980 UF-70]EDN93352.1 predicted protein [Sclerotinia sclerotiorum 1980 UF-70]